VPIKNLTRGDRFGAQVSPLAEEKKIFFNSVFDVGVKQKIASLRVGKNISSCSDIQSRHKGYAFACERVQK